MEKTVKIVLAALLFLCLANMPYGYFQFVRFISFVAFAIFAWQSYDEENNNLAIFYIALALLFQPFFKISLGRELWNIVDVGVGVWLLIAAFQKDGNSKE